MTVKGYPIDLQIADEYANDVDADFLTRVIRSTLDAASEPPEASLAVVIASDDAVRELNRAYRHIDRPTDVLSFPTRDGPDFVVPGEAELYLGDVIISWPTARAQADEAGHSVRDELALLVVHGCLHLLGYDHATDAERSEMWERQESILDQYGISWFADQA